MTDTPALRSQSIPAPSASAPAPIRPRVDERAAAARLGVSRRTLQQWRVKGGGPKYLKLGRAVRYDLAELDRWERSRTKMHTADPGPDAA